MRIQTFVSGLVVIALGVTAGRLLPKADALGFLTGALTLGGGILICGLFSLKSYWHGLIGAGVMGLLGAARGLGNLPDMLRLLQGDRQRGAAPIMEMGVAVICLLLVLRVVGALLRERTRRMLEREE
jgi:hypothetical protein